MSEQVRLEAEHLVNDFVNSNPMLRQALAKMMGSMPRMCFWDAPKYARYQFGYNTEPLTPSPATKGRKWGAVVYRKHANGHMEIVKVIYFRSRKAAKARSLRWYYAAQSRKEKRNLESLYAEFASLGGNADELCKCNPTEAQLAGLVAGMKKLVGKSDAQLWNDGE